MQGLDVDSEMDDDSSSTNRQFKATAAASKRESKLIELNLANNKFTKIPQCLSCLAPKLAKLNMSSNRLESMGAVCDLPSGLKFLDLSNNLIKRSMHLLNENLLKFIFYYYSKYTSAHLSDEFLNGTLINLLLENDFCYLNLILKSLNKNAAAFVDSIKTISRAPNALAAPLYLVHDSSASKNENLRDMSKHRFPPTGYVNQHIQNSTSPANQQKRRTRSQSRSARTFLTSPPSASSQNSPNLSEAQQLKHASNVANQKRLLPFDLFLVNLKYNQAYAGTAYRDMPQNRQQLLESVYLMLKSDLDLTNMEKILLNSQNLQVFLEQLCPHKRHIKLENLKSINLSQNKMKKLTFMFELAPAQCSVEDLEKLFERLSTPAKKSQVRI